MSNSPIEQAKDPDLIGSLHAMRRAAVRARQIAAQTGTVLIVWRDGKIQREMVNEEKKQKVLALETANSQIERA